MRCLIRACVVTAMFVARLRDSFQAKSQFKSRSIANNVEIIIPVPTDVDSPSFKASIGSVTYLPDQVRSQTRVDVIMRQRASRWRVRGSRPVRILWAVDLG